MTDREKQIVKQLNHPYKMMSLEFGMERIWKNSRKWSSLVHKTEICATKGDKRIELEGRSGGQGSKTTIST